MKPNKPEIEPDWFCQRKQDGYFSFLIKIEGFEKKLSDWKEKLMSTCGLLVLLNAVLRPCLVLRL
jgi:hypothetical protein